MRLGQCATAVTTADEARLILKPNFSSQTESILLEIIKTFYSENSYSKLIIGFDFAFTQLIWMLIFFLGSNESEMEEVEKPERKKTKKGKKKVPQKNKVGFELMTSDCNNWIL